MAPPIRLDFMILGATGFTGLHCIPYVYKVAKEKDLTWGIAGRSDDKLKDALVQVGKKVEADLSETPIIITDIKDDDSLLKMAQRAKVVINCCGSYQVLGVPVVKACIAAGSHYVDISTEPQFIESIQLQYDEIAREKGIYIVNACGFDCIPTDFGLVYLQEKFDGVLNSVVTYLKVWTEGKVSGPLVNYGTWQSLVDGLKNATKLSQLKKLLNRNKLPSFKFKPKLKSNFLPHHSDIVEGWVIPFPGTDRPFMERTQRYLYENESKRPIQVDTFFTLPHFIQIIGIVLCLLIWSIFAKFEFGRRWLLDYPKIFTFGIFGKDPLEETINKQWFQITFYGEGWKEKLANKDDQYATPPNKSIIAKLQGRNPGYGTTCAGVVGSALMIVTEKNKLPQNGGVYTPGIAFKNTSLMKYLMDNEITFEVVSEKYL